MKKTYSYIILILLFISPVYASSSDSMVTVYKDGEFVSRYQQLIRTTPDIAASVVNDLVNEFHNSPENLFNWAFKGLGLQEKTDNELIFVIKPSVFDKKTGITHGNFDIIVPHIKTFKDVKVDAIVSKKQLRNGETKATAEIIYSSLLLKHAQGSATMIPQKNNEQLLITDVSIKFGWFFNIFITKKRYKSIVEWRIKKFSENLKAECEKRQKSMNAVSGKNN